MSSTAQPREVARATGAALQGCLARRLSTHCRAFTISWCNRSIIIILHIDSYSRGCRTQRPPQQPSLAILSPLAQSANAANTAGAVCGGNLRANSGHCGPSAPAAYAGGGGAVHTCSSRQRSAIAMTVQKPSRCASLTLRQRQKTARLGPWPPQHEAATLCIPPVAGRPLLLLCSKPCRSKSGMRHELGTQNTSLIDHSASM